MFFRKLFTIIYLPLPQILCHFSTHVRSPPSRACSSFKCFLPPLLHVCLCCKDFMSSLPQPLGFGSKSVTVDRNKNDEVNQTNSNQGANDNFRSKNSGSTQTISNQDESNGRTMRNYDFDETAGSCNGADAIIDKCLELHDKGDQETKFSNELLCNWKCLAVKVKARSISFPQLTTSENSFPMGRNYFYLMPFPRLLVQSAHQNWTVAALGSGSLTCLHYGHYTTTEDDDVTKHASALKYTLQVRAYLNFNFCMMKRVLKTRKYLSSCFGRGTNHPVENPRYAVLEGTSNGKSKFEYPSCKLISTYKNIYEHVVNCLLRYGRSLK